MAPIKVIAPTIVRFTMQHINGNGRPTDCVVDVSVDENAMTRHDAVNQVAPLIRDAWQDSMVSPMPTNVNFTGCHYIDLDSLGGISGQLGFNSAKTHTGTYGGAVASSNVAILCHKNAGATRGTRNGRMYLPPPVESVTNDDGTLNSTVIATVNGALQSLHDKILAAGPILPPVTTAWRVVHVVGHDGVPAPGYPQGKPNAWNSTDVTSAYCDNKLATMRRRLRK